MNYIYINEDSIDSLLKCRLCSKPFIDPVRTRDGQLCCRLCITQQVTIVNTSEENYQPSFLDNLVSIEERIIHEMLDNLLVQCPDCQELNIRRKDLKIHLLTQCPKRIILCKASDLKCPWSGCYDQSAEHILTCTFELLRPILSERCQHGAEFEQYQRSIEEQRNEIAQLKKQVEEYRDRVEKLQKGFRTFWEINSQQRQKCEKFQNDIQQDITEENLRRNQLNDDIQQLREQFDQMNVLCQEMKENLSNSNSSQTNEMENIHQQLNQIKISQDYENQIKQFQQQESFRKDEMLRIRQMCNQHGIQIGLLARKKCVVPMSK